MPRRYLNRIKLCIRKRAGRGEPETVETGRAEERPDALCFDPDEIDSRSAIVAELGVSPATFVEWIVEREGGRMLQSTFRDYTNFSPATTSRLLSELEEEGVIERIRTGRQNIITLPGDSTSDE